MMLNRSQTEVLEHIHTNAMRLSESPENGHRHYLTETRQHSQVAPVIGPTLYESGLPMHPPPSALLQRKGKISVRQTNQTL